MSVPVLLFSDNTESKMERKKTMEQIIISVNRDDKIDSKLSAYNLEEKAEKARTIFVQIYTSVNEKEWLHDIAYNIKTILPSAVITGATTNGEVIRGFTTTEKTLLAFSFFQTSQVELLRFCCSGWEEYEMGEHIYRSIEQRSNDIAGVMFLCTAISMDSVKLLTPLSKLTGDYPFFGGAAGYYQFPNQSLVLCDTEVYEQGIAVIIFRGNNLHIEALSVLGWKTFSREMTITAAEDMTVKTVDDKPAFSIYEHYLGIENDSDFATNVVGFSFILERNGCQVVRVPIAVTNDGGLLFGADVHTGEKFRIGYADPGMILEQVKKLHRKLRDFNPDGIFLFSCWTRRIILQDDVQMETMPFGEIAPTLGFYTAGEYYGRRSDLEVNNSTIVAVGIREGPADQEKFPAEKRLYELTCPVIPTKLQQRDTKAIGRLIRFIEAVTGELDQANKELAQLAACDKLTHIYNRIKLDEVLTYEISRAERYATSFSLLLVDIDYFKQVNDNFGHLRGDEILVEFADRMRHIFKRDTDIIGRWGGEEFLCIIPDDSSNAARKLAENLRLSVCNNRFLNDLEITCSIGVTTYQEHDSENSILHRVDKALYEAKHLGRNRVILI